VRAPLSTASFPVTAPVTAAEYLQFSQSLLRICGVVRRSVSISEAVDPKLHGLYIFDALDKFDRAMSAQQYPRLADKTGTGC
jgi:hypothetical protein